MNKKPRLGDDPLLPFIKNSSKEAQPKAQAKKKAQPKAQAQANPQAKAQEVKERIAQGLKPGRLEDTRTRRTYWLLEEDIEKIDQLAREAGTAKHNIIGAAVSLLYDYVFKEGGA